jgi:hypothetical protein
MTSAVKPPLGPPEASEGPEFRGLLSEFGRGLLNVGIDGLNPSPFLPDFQRSADDERGQNAAAVQLPTDSSNEAQSSASENDDELAGENATERRSFRDIVDAKFLSDAGHREKFAYPEIGRAEGDRPVHNSKRPDAPTVAGISYEALRPLRDKIPGASSVVQPQDLTPEQRAHFYRAYFDREFPDAFGHDTFDQIEHTGVTAFVADTVFREGAKGQKMIQEAINTVRKAQRQRGTNVDDIKVTGRFGLDSLYALNKAIQDPDDRQKFARELKLRRDSIHQDPATWKGEAFRTQRFYELATAKDQ